MAETYIHRIGRTGRAGEEGVAFSFCSNDEKPYLKDINKLLKRDIQVVKQDGNHKIISMPAKSYNYNERRQRVNAG